MYIYEIHGDFDKKFDYKAYLKRQIMFFFPFIDLLI